MGCIHFGHGIQNKSDSHLHTAAENSWVSHKERAAIKIAFELADETRSLVEERWHIKGGIRGLSSAARHRLTQGFVEILREQGLDHEITHRAGFVSMTGTLDNRWFLRKGSEQKYRELLPVTVPLYSDDTNTENPLRFACDQIPFLIDPKTRTLFVDAPIQSNEQLYVPVGKISDEMVRRIRSL